MASALKFRLKSSGQDAIAKWSSGVKFFRRQSQEKEENVAEKVSNDCLPFKVVFLGDSSVGKTCLARLLTEEKVQPTTDNTIGFDLHSKELIVDGVRVIIQLWDTAGMEQFRNTLIGQYYRNVDGVVLVYDITRRETFDHLQDWLMEVRHNCRSMEMLKMVLIGNKSDQDKREVEINEGQEYADGLSMTQFLETSAKNEKSLEQLREMLFLLARSMLAAREEHSFTRSMSSVIRLEHPPIDEGWETIEIPRGPIPRSSHCHQDRRSRLGNTLNNKCQCF